MIQFIQELWACWQQVQEERAKFYAKHGSYWE